MADTKHTRARTVWRSWVFRGYVGITCLIALWVALADPFALADETRGGLYAYLFPPLLFIGLMAGLGWLAFVVFRGPDTRVDDGGKPDTAHDRSGK